MYKNGKIISVMGRVKTPIYKWSAQGKLVKAYESFNATIAAERMGNHKFLQALSTGAIFCGHYWTRSPDKPVIRKGHIQVKNEAEMPQPWEGKDGLFNIEGWGRVMAMEPKLEDKIPRLVQNQVIVRKTYLKRRTF
jgi:hypothetical protein